MATIKLTGLNNIGQVTGIGTTDTSAIDGSVTLGDADTDSIVVNAEFDSDLVPNIDENYSLGEINKKWKNVYAGVYYGDGSQLTGITPELTISGADGAVQYKDGTDLNGSGHLFYKSGKIGIGDFSVDSPTYLLSMKGNTGGGQTSSVIEMLDFNFSPTIMLQRRNGNSQSYSSVADNNTLGQFAFLGWNSVANQPQTGAIIKAVISGTPAQTSADMPTELQFYTTPNSSSQPSQRMTIMPTGMVGIGTDNPGFQLDVANGGIRTWATGGGSFSVAHNSNGSNPTAGTSLGSLRYGTEIDQAQTVLESKVQQNWSSFNKATYLDIKTTGYMDLSPTTRIQVSDNEISLTSPTKITNTLSVTQNIEVNNNGGYVAVKATNTSLESKLGLATLETGTVYANALVSNNNLNTSIPSNLIFLSYTTVSDTIQINAGTTSSKSGVSVQILDQNDEIPFRINPNGKVYLGTQSGEAQYTNFEYDTGNGVHIEGFDDNGPAMVVVNRSVNTDSDGISIILGEGIYSNSQGTYDYPTTNNRFLKFYTKRRPYNSPFGLPNQAPEMIGYVRGDGAGGVAYISSFTGLHASVIDTVEITNGATTGMIVESTGTIWHQPNNDETNVSTALPKVTLSSSDKSKRVYGVIGSLTGDFQGYLSASPLKEGETHIEVNAVGEGKIWITNLNGNIENGDYITTSTIKGYGQAQDDDLMHNYTVAKCTENIDWDNVLTTISHNGQTYKKYLSACTYHCG